MGGIYSWNSHWYENFAMRIHKIFGSIVIFALYYVCRGVFYLVDFFRKKTYVYLSFSDFFGVRIRKIQFCNLRCELVAEVFLTSLKRNLLQGLVYYSFGILSWNRLWIKKNKVLIYDWLTINSHLIQLLVQLDFNVQFFYVKALSHKGDKNIFLLIHRLASY